MSDKIKKATELLEGIKSLLQPVSGHVMAVMTPEDWDKVMQAKSLLRSISPEESKAEAGPRHLHGEVIRYLPSNIAASSKIRIEKYIEDCHIHIDALEAKPTPSPKATCEDCPHFDGCWTVQNPIKNCKDFRFKSGSISSEPPKPKGHTPDCAFTLDGYACTCGYRTAPKPETFLKPAKDKCELCFAHPDKIDSCERCGGSGKEPTVEPKAEARITDSLERGQANREIERLEAENKTAKAELGGILDSSNAVITQLKAQLVSANDGVKHGEEVFADLQTEIDSLKAKLADTKETTVKQKAEAGEFVMRTSDAFPITRADTIQYICDCHYEIRRLEAEIVKLTDAPGYTQKIASHVWWAIKDFKDQVAELSAHCDCPQCKAYAKSGECDVPIRKCIAIRGLGDCADCTEHGKHKPK